MKNTTKAVIRDLVARYPKLVNVEASIFEVVEAIIASYKAGGKMLICGNGGSASDAMHIVGELMKDFVIPRKLPIEIQEKIKASAGEHAKYIIANLQGTLPAISLVNEIAFSTAYANDITPDLSFAQQVYGYGNQGDILISISTSGNSKNIIYAAEVAKAMGVKVIALTGATGGKLKDKCDYLIDVPETESFKVQELHLPVYHAICLALENEFFSEEA